MSVKRFLIGLVKVVASCGLLAYLFWDAYRSDAFEYLWQQPKQWPLLGAALVLCLTAVVLTLVRWCLLVRALRMAFGLRDALRIGFLGYLFNLAPMGILGGDMLKMFLLAREQRAHRPEAVATVVVDRLIGLYALFVVASVAAVSTGFFRSAAPEIRLICWATFATAVAGAVVAVAIWSPMVPLERVRRAVERVPYVGAVSGRMIGAVEHYRQSPGTLLVALLFSFGVHSCFAIAMYLIACSLFSCVPALSTHFVVCPLSAAAGVLPLPMGPTEFVLDRLYLFVPVPGGSRMLPGQGLVVVLAYRVITLIVAGIGLVYYLTCRKEVAEVLEHANELAEPPQ